MPIFKTNTRLGTKDPLWETDDLSDKIITTDKLADKAVTSEKLADDIFAVATPSEDGLMSADDKTKLDGDSATTNQVLTKKSDGTTGWADQQGGGSGGGNVDDVTAYGSSLVTNRVAILDGIYDKVAALEAKVFPLEASYASHNAGTKEEGTEVIPTATLNITRQGSDVSSSATLTTSPTSTISSDNKTFTGSAISSGSVSYRPTVVQGGQTISLSALTWSFTNYRYYGEVSAVPTDYPTAIKALSGKQLSTASTLGATTLSANKYYLFAVKGTPTLICRHASTEGVISGCITGTCEVTQENDNTKSNTYSYILVPASTSAWSFKITNS